jgi:ElaB/YqjD/DUF883 family membrane-anchored ribosome-binding protein
MNDMLTAPVQDVQVAKEKLARDLRNTIEDTEELLRLTAEQMGERIVEVRRRVQSSLAQSRVQLARLQSEAMTRGKEATTQVDEYVNANPWKAIGIVGLAGLVVGALIARR